MIDDQREHTSNACHVADSTSILVVCSSPTFLPSLTNQPLSLSQVSSHYLSLTMFGGEHPQALYRKISLESTRANASPPLRSTPSPAYRA